MPRIYTSVEELIGRTPLLELGRLSARLGLSARLLGKLESFNPAGSAKDRVAKSMLDDAEARWILKPGAVIIEPTSGNTGIGLCSVAAARGYQVVIVMPDTMSAERRLLMQAYGARLVLTDGAKGMAGAIEAAQKLAEETPGAFIPGQFVNPANSEAHRHWPGNLGGHRGPSGHFCGWGGHRRHHHRGGSILEGAESPDSNCGGGARWLPCACGRRGRKP